MQPWARPRLCFSAPRPLGEPTSSKPLLQAHEAMVERAKQTELGCVTSSCCVAAVRWCLGSSPLPFPTSASRPRAQPSPWGRFWLAWDVPRGCALGQKGTRLPWLGGDRACEGNTEGEEPKRRPTPPFARLKVRERRQPRASSRRPSSAPSPQPGPAGPGLSPRRRKRAPTTEKASPSHPHATSTPLLHASGHRGPASRIRSSTATCPWLGLSSRHQSSTQYCYCAKW